LADLEGADELRARLKAIGETRQMMGTIALVAVREAKMLVPRRTGNLGRTIRVGRVTSTDAEVLAGGRLNVGYAAAVEFGTRPHIIVPRRARMLAWGGARTLGGRLRKGARATHFARMVRHPGTRAQPYLVPGIKKALEKAGIAANIVDAWNRAA
jgi:hypothetical protein